MTAAITTAAPATAAPATRSVPTDHALSHPAYRPDIDGLRAVAVVSVVVFHAFPSSARGGFIGVDIFFIISGFLISTIIFGNLRRDTFSIVEFYNRRIKRIFPALLVVLLATFGFGWMTLMADEYAQLGKHVAAGASFVSNLVFWGEAGYFDTAGETKPLLHLWSLGIEEQFYIFWPVVLSVAWRLRANFLVVTAVTALASFAYNIHLVTHDPVADFYSPFSRFWELALGSGLAYLTLFERTAMQRMSALGRDVQSLTGGAIIAVGMVATTASSAFPGWWALLPTVGALLVIAAGSQAWFNRVVMSHRLMVWIGLISFPLYLWHWPILSFVRILAAERPTRLARVAAIVAAVLLAYLTYRLVEIPVRKGAEKRWLPMALLAAMALLGAVGFAGFHDDGFTFRAAANRAVVHPGDLGHDAFYAYTATHFVPCASKAVFDNAEKYRDFVRCSQTRVGPIDVAIVGDSHAEHLFIGLAEALAPLNVVFYTRSSLPVVTNHQFDPIFAAVLRDPNIRTVIISAWWPLRAAEAGSRTAFADTLGATVTRLADAGKTVYIADDVPNFSSSPRLCKYEGSVLRVNKCEDDLAFNQRQYDGYIGTLKSLEARSPRVRGLNTTQYFCDATRCSMVHDGRLLFRDSDHLNVDGTRFLGRRLVADHPELRQVPAAALPP